MIDTIERRPDLHVDQSLSPMQPSLHWLFSFFGRGLLWSQRRRDPCRAGDRAAERARRLDGERAHEQRRHDEQRHHDPRGPAPPAGRNPPPLERGRSSESEFSLYSV